MQNYLGRIQNSMILCLHFCRIDLIHCSVYRHAICTKTRHLLNFRLISISTGESTKFKHRRLFHLYRRSSSILIAFILRDVFVTERCNRFLTIDFVRKSDIQSKKSCWRSESSYSSFTFGAVCKS